MTNLKAADYIEKINMAALEAKLEELTGMKVEMKVELNRRLLMGRGSKEVISLTTGNLVEQTGIMKAAFSSVVINSDSCTGLLEGPDGVEYCVRLGFRYELKEGGSNGAHIVQAHYSFATNEWMFRDNG